MLAWPAFEVGVQKVNNQHESLTFSAVLHSVLERVCTSAGKNGRWRAGTAPHVSQAPKRRQHDSMRQLDMDSISVFGYRKCSPSKITRPPSVQLRVSPPTVIAQPCGGTSSPRCTRIR